MKKIKIRGIRWGRVFTAVLVISCTVALSLRLDSHLFPDISGADEPSTVVEFSHDLEDNQFENRLQYYQGAKVTYLASNATIKIVDVNKQESEVQLDGISHLDRINASDFISKLLAENTFVVQYSTDNIGQIYINSQSLSSLLIEKGYAK